jgi:hypothetical protein
MVLGASQIPVLLRLRSDQSFFVKKQNMVLGASQIPVLLRLRSDRSSVIWREAGIRYRN